MSQDWLSHDPAQNRSLLQQTLQIGLFDECPDGPDASIGTQNDQAKQHEGGYAPCVPDYAPEGTGFQPELVFNEQDAAAGSPARGLGDDLEAAIFSGAQEPLQKRRRGASEPVGPDLDLNDERLLYFRHVGVRDLFAEMVLQSMRDMAFSKDDERMARLLDKSPEDHEEMLLSADWLATKDGQLAVQMLYPDWDHMAILKRIFQDPQGILERMASVGEKRTKESEAASGFADAKLIGGSLWGASVDAYWPDLDVNAGSEEYSFRHS